MPGTSIRPLHKVLSTILVPLVGLAWCSGAVFAAEYSIPEDQLASEQVYYGTHKSFSNPGEIDYQALLKATPEYKEIKREGIERGTGKYWILLSQASDRVVRVVSDIGENNEYDLIAAKGYLGSLNPSIPAEDITSLVLDELEERIQSS